MRRYKTIFSDPDLEIADGLKEICKTKCCVCVACSVAS